MLSRPQRHALARLPRWMRRAALVLSAALAIASCGLAPQRAEPEPSTQAPAIQSPLNGEPKLRPPMPAAANLSMEPDLWTRFRRDLHWQPCTVTPEINQWIRRYAAKPERFAGSIAPAVPLLDYVLTRAEALDLPSEIALVPIIESYYRPDARGPGGALGLWQLMPDTGRLFGLHGSGNQDDRLDVHASTDAALRLLKLNADAFSNNPKLMFAAYNAGAYRLRKALAGRDQAGLTSLDGLGLPRTTREYITKLKALGCLLGEPERFALALPPLPEAARLVEFRSTFPVDPTTLSQRLGIDVAELRRWNQRAFSRSATDGVLLLPRGLLATAEIVAAELPQVTPKPAVAAALAKSGRGHTHKVASGDSLWTISKRYRVRLADLMRWNGLTRRSVLRIGQTLKLQQDS